MAHDTLRDMHSRMRGIESTQKIARAMYLSSSAKLTRAVERMEDSAVFREQAAEMLGIMYTAKEAKAGKSCRIVIAGDRGMSGGYNNAVFAVLRTGDDAVYLPVGRKAFEKIISTGAETISEEVISSEKISFSDIRLQAKKICEMIRNGSVGRVEIIGAAWGGGVRCETVIPPGKPGVKPEMIVFETQAAEILDNMLADMLASIIYAYICEAAACENLSRRLAMDAAQRNAEKMLEEMKIELNRRRRAGITQEIIEAVSGYAAENRE